MSNPYYTKPAYVVPGTTIRADKYNSDLDLSESAFNALDNKLQQALFLPSTFQGNPTIPEQTVNDTFLYINSVGDLSLYPIATFLEQFELVTAQYNQINSWQQQVAGNAIDAQNSASLSQRYANEAEDTEVEQGFFSAKHWSLKAAAQLPILEAAGQAKVDEAEQAVIDAQAQVSLATTQASNASTSASNASGFATLSEDFANHPANIIVPNSAGKYSAFHWAKEAESYAQQTLEAVNGDFVPNSRTVNGKALSANIVLNAADVGALPNSTTLSTLGGVPTTRTVNGQALSTNITLNAASVGALPASTSAADIGGVPTTRTVNGKALSTNISLNFSDVGALSSSTTLSTLGGVPATRQINGKALSSNIALNASDVGALPNTTTLNTLGGVPTSRKVNGKALNGNITLSHSDVGALPNTQKGVSVTRVTGSFTATKNAGITKYITSATTNSACTINNNAFSPGDELIIKKQRLEGELVITAGVNIVLPNGQSGTSHNVPDGYACTIELTFNSSNIEARIY